MGSARQEIAHLGQLGWPVSEQREVEVTLAYFEHWLSVGKFEYVNDLLRGYFPIADAALATLLAILSITYPAKDKLPYRYFFVMNVEDHLTATLGVERAEKLLEHRR